MSRIQSASSLADQAFRIVDIEEVGTNEYIVTTESKAYGTVRQRLSVVPDLETDKVQDQRRHAETCACD